MLISTSFQSSRDKEIDAMWARIDPWMQRRYELELKKEKEMSGS